MQGLRSFIDRLPATDVTKLWNCIYFKEMQCKDAAMNGWLNAIKNRGKGFTSRVRQLLSNALTSTPQNLPKCDGDGSWTVGPAREPGERFATLQDFFTEQGQQKYLPVSSSSNAGAK